MRQLFDELDEEGNLVESGIMLIPGLTLPDGHKWVEHIIPLEELKLAKKLEIDKIRDLVCFSTVSALGHIWQIDSKSQALLSNALVLSQLGITPVPPTWRTLDNIDVPISIDDLKQIVVATATNVQAAYTQAWALKASIDAATSINELNSIEWQF